jgi:hypothetical protein
MQLEEPTGAQQETRDDAQEISKLETDLGGHIQSLTEYDHRIQEVLDAETEPIKLRSITQAYEKAKGRINAAVIGAGLVAASEVLLGYVGESPSMTATGLMIGGNIALATFVVGHGLNLCHARAAELLSKE